MKNCGWLRTSIASASCGLSVLALSSVAEAANFTVYTDQASWEAAVSNFTTETFDDNVFTDFSVTSFSTDPIYSGIAQDGVWKDQISDENGPTTWTFNSALTGWGGLWDLSKPEGSGTGIELTFTFLDDTTQTLGNELLNTFNNNFFGIVSDVAFKSIALTEGTQVGFVETYTLDNMVYSSNSASTPEPGSVLGLFALGGLGGALLRARKSKQS